MNLPGFTAQNFVYRQERKNKLAAWIIALFTSLALLLLLPWTQNIRARGSVTTLTLEQRPQQVNTIIGGRIEQWMVKEGDIVNKGDTLLKLSEIKTDYLDPNLLGRTSEQIQSKKLAVEYYGSKIGAADQQITALKGALETKIGQLQTKYRQAQAKAQSDSMDMEAARNQFTIATNQYNRQKFLYDSGLVSLTQLEQRNQALQVALFNKIGAENKFYASKQELGIILLDLNGSQQEYTEKIAKAQSDRFSSLSAIATSQADIAKLENDYASYAIRNGMYYILAPQSGQIIQARKAGIGEIVKEGDMIVHIVPERTDHAVELYLNPADLPLVHEGQKVRFLFDGFPAIVFSGWPKASYGTYQGTVSAIESDVSSNGKFKVLVKEDTTYRKWPPELKIGTGANGIALLKTVPLWYEFWRNINAFPPDYYKSKPQEEKK